MRASLHLGQPRPGWQLTLFGIATAAMLGGSAYLLSMSWPLLFPKPVFSGAAECNLHTGACTAALDQTHAIRLDIEPKTLPPNAPLRVLVDTAGFVADSVSIEFRGVDMNMGLIKNELFDTGDGSFSGDAILPVCIRKDMAWRAMVTARGANGMYQAAFDFKVHRP